MARLETNEKHRQHIAMVVRHWCREHHIGLPADIDIVSTYAPWVLKTYGGLPEADRVAVLNRLDESINRVSKLWDILPDRPRIAGIELVRSDKAWAWSMPYVQTYLGDLDSPISDCILAIAIRALDTLPRDAAGRKRESLDMDKMTKLASLPTGAHVRYEGQELEFVSVSVQIRCKDADGKPITVALNKIELIP